MKEASKMKSLHKVKAIVAVGDDGLCHVLRADHYLKLALLEVPFPVLKVTTGAGIYRWEGTVSNGKILDEGEFTQQSDLPILHPCQKCCGRGKMWYGGGNSYTMPCAQCKGTGYQPEDMR